MAGASAAHRPATTNRLVFGATVTRTFPLCHDFLLGLLCLLCLRTALCPLQRSARMAPKGECGSRADGALFCRRLCVLTDRLALCVSRVDPFVMHAAAKRAVTPAREGEHAIKLGSSHDSAFAAAAANGGTPGAKRKARPSADEAGPSSSLSLAAQNGDAAAASTPVSNKVNGAAATTSTSPSTLRDVKRLKRASMSTAPGTPGKRQLPAYVVRQGMNPLPAPIPPITQSVLKSGYAPAVTSPFTRTPAAAEAHLKQGPTIPREAFVFGNGDMGQHGLGTEVLDEIKRPRRHAWVAKMIGEGKLGAGGLAVVAAGGMHTLAIDSTGRIFSWGINDNACLGRQTTRTGSAEDFETEPMPVEGLSPNGVGIRGGAAPIGGTEGPVEIFRATRVAAGDSVSAALNERGEVRVWGSFRVSVRSRADATMRMGATHLQRADAACQYACATVE